MRHALLAVLAVLAFGRAAAAVTVSVHDQAGPAADVVVALEPLDAHPPPAGASASIDQVNKTFVPHISVVQVGTSMDFPNSDRIRHEVYSFSPAKVFTLKLYAGRSAAPVVFDRPGLIVLGCNIHDQMSAFVAVVDTPYFGRTGADGRLRFAAPPGRYRLRIWHPALEHPMPLQPVTLAEGSERVLDVAIVRLADPPEVADWSY